MPPPILLSISPRRDGCSILESLEKKRLSPDLDALSALRESPELLVTPKTQQLFSFKKGIKNGPQYAHDAVFSLQKVAQSQLRERDLFFGKLNPNAQSFQPPEAVDQTQNWFLPRPVSIHRFDPNIWVSRKSGDQPRQKIEIPYHLLPSLFPKQKEGEEVVRDNSTSLSEAQNQTECQGEVVGMNQQILSPTIQPPLEMQLPFLKDVPVNTVISSTPKKCKTSKRCFVKKN